VVGELIDELVEQRRQTIANDGQRGGRHERRAHAVGQTVVRGTVEGEHVLAQAVAQPGRLGVAAEQVGVLAHLHHVVPTGDQPHAQAGHERDRLVLLQLGEHRVRVAFEQLQVDVGRTHGGGHARRLTPRSGLRPAMRRYITTRSMTTDTARAAMTATAPCLEIG